MQSFIVEDLLNISQWNPIQMADIHRVDQQRTCFSIDRLAFSSTKSMGQAKLS